MRRKRITWLIIILPVMALAIGSAAYLKKVSRELARRLPPALSLEISKRVNGEVRFGKVDVYPLGIVVRDVSISQQHAEIVRVPRLKVACRIWDVVTGKIDPSTSIKRIELLEPTIHLVRTADGKWNLQGIMKPSKGKKPKFGAKVFVRSAHITLRDFKPSPAQPMLNKLDGVDAIIDFTGQPKVQFSAWGKNQPRFKRFDADGSYDTDGHKLQITIEVAGADARYFSKYPYRVGLDIVSGKADGLIGLTKTPRDKRIRYSVVVTPHDASVRFPQIRRPITGINGKVYVQDGSASMRLQANLGSSPFTVAGNVTDFKHVKVGLGIISNQLNFREAASITGYADRLKQVSLPGTGRIRAWVSGPPKSLTVGFDAGAPTVGWHGLTGRAVSALGAYTRGRIVVHRASLSTCGGRLDGSGTIELSKPTSAEFSGRASGIKLSEVPMLAKQKLSTSSSGDFQVSLKNGDATVRYLGDASDFSFHGLRFDQGKVDVSYENGRTKINEISARTLDGLVAISGEISKDGKLSLDASGANINLAKVRDRYWKPQTVGHGEFQGKVTGTLAAPVFKGEVTASKVMFSDIALERVSGNVTLNRNRLSIENMVAHHYPGTLTVSGGVNSLSKSPTVNLIVKADSLEIGGVSDAYGKYLPEGGKLSGQATAYGPLRTAILTADLRVAGGEVRGVPLDVVVFKGKYSGNKLSVQELSAQVGESSVVIKGDLDRDGKLAGTIESKQLALERFSGLFGPYADISGNAEIAGTIAGTLDDPSIDFSVNCEQPVVNYQVFQQFGAEASLHGRVITLSDVSLSDSASNYDVRTAEYDLDTNLLKINAHVENGSLEKVLSIVRRSPSATGPNHVRLKTWLSKLPKPFAGTLTANVSGTARLGEGRADPDLQADLLVSNAAVGGNSFKSVVLKGSWKNDVARLEKLEATDGGLALSAAGSIGPKKALDLKMNAKGLDIATICQWLGSPHNFSGKADVTVVASGTTRAPSTEMNLDISGPVIGGAKFDSLKSRLTLTRKLTEGTGEPHYDDRIDISELTLGQGDRTLRVSGYIPVDLHTFKMAKNVPMLVQANLDGDSLAILSKCTGLNMETGTSGKFEGLVKLSGTSDKPVLEGNLDWTDGRVQVPKLNSPLEGITARLHLVGDKITVDELTGRSAEGGAFVVIPGPSLRRYSSVSSYRSGRQWYRTRLLKLPREVTATTRCSHLWLAQAVRARL